MNLRLIVLFFLAFSISADEIVEQRYQILKADGEAKIWSREKKAWENFDTQSYVGAGSTIKTKNGSHLRFSFEPAITMCIKGESVFSNNKMLVNKTINAIRMSHRLDEGLLEVQMPKKLGYKLFMTVKTPTAAINMRGGTTDIEVKNNVTVVKALKDNVLVENLSSKIRTIVPAGAKAIVSPGNSAVNVTSLEDEEYTHGIKPITSTKPDEAPSIAILSIQSREVSAPNLAPISDMVAKEVTTKSNTQVFYLDDVRAMLKAEGIDDLLNCYSDSCISRIGSFIGVDKVVIGRLGRLGKSFVFDLKMVDVLRDRTINRASVSVTEDLGKVLTEIPSVVGNLVKKDPSYKSKSTTSTISKSSPDNGNIEDLGNHMAKIRAGTFMMGSLPGSSGSYDELPQHKVNISEFYMDKFEVSRAAFKEVMGYNPSSFKGCMECPADNVSWEEAQQYCQKVGKRLPTEAEWEYACRAGTLTEFHYGNALSSYDANFNGRFPYGGVSSGPFRKKVLPPGSYKPNNWGLFDMHGNLSEWCSDWHSPTYYEESKESDPKGPKDGKFKIVRGGNWKSEGKHLRSSNRNSFNPKIKVNTLGFRCVKDNK